MATFSDLVITKWHARFKGRVFACATGRCGIGDKTREGDGITPSGVYDFKTVFARHDRVGPLGKDINLADGWSDDPDDLRYNQRIRSRSHPYSFERMRRSDPLYDIVVDIGFNDTALTIGGGSAIFLHIWRKPRHPTEGCVAFSRRDLIWILSQRDKNSRIMIRA